MVLAIGKTFRLDWLGAGFRNWPMGREKSWWGKTDLNWSQTERLRLCGSDG